MRRHSSRQWPIRISPRTVIISMLSGEAPALTFGSGWWRERWSNWQAGTRWTRNTQVQQILTVQSGQPFTPILTFDNSNTGNTGGSSGSDRPNIVGDANAGSCPNPTGGSAIPVGTPNCWFNTSAFAIAPQYTFGNAGRNILRGSGFASFDLSLQRRFNLWEGTQLTFQAQAFNLFNRSNFDLPQPAVSFGPGSLFGRILSAKPARQLQMALRFSF